MRFAATARSITAFLATFLTSILLSFLGLFPVLGFVPLGYLFRSQQQIVQSGSLSHAVPNNRQWTQFWQTSLPWLMILLPMLLLDTLARQAAYIKPDDHLVAGLVYLLPGLWIATLAHLAAAQIRGGGSLFGRPINNARWIITLPSAQRRSLVASGLHRSWLFFNATTDLFLLGVRGYVAVLSWLVIPSLLIHLVISHPYLQWPGIISLAMAVPFAILGGVRFAVEDRILAAWDVRDLVRRIRRAPWALVLTLVVIDLLTVPIWVAKIEKPIWEIAWALNVVCFWAVWPGRILAAWTYSQPGDDTRTISFVRRPLAYVLIAFLSIFYAMALFLMHPISWLGTRLPFAQHAFLLPIVH
jgi:hypothetical protein